MNKEIEEMAKVIGDADQRCYEIDDCNSCPFHHIELGLCKERFVADALYTEGYRKQKVGRWIEHDDDWCGFFYTCSSCGCDWTTIDGTPQENNMRFCPECGAKMEGGE